MYFFNINIYKNIDYYVNTFINQTSNAEKQDLFEQFVPKF